MPIDKCRHCKENKVIVIFGYCMDCAKELGAKPNENMPN